MCISAKKFFISAKQNGGRPCWQTSPPSSRRSGIDLFDSLFKTQSTWVASIVWLKAVFGLDMDPGEQPTKFELVINPKDR